MNDIKYIGMDVQQRTTLIDVLNASGPVLTSALVETQGQAEVHTAQKVLEARIGAKAVVAGIDLEKTGALITAPPPPTTGSPRRRSISRSKATDSSLARKG